MNDLWLILVAGFGVYALRFTGLVVPLSRMPTRWEQSFEFIPVSLLASLVVVTIRAAGDEMDIRLLAATGAAFAVWRLPRMWLCIIVGMTLYALLRLL